MYCKNCGEQIPEDSKFCLNCGVAISEELKPTETPEDSEQLVKPEDQKEHKGCGRILVLFSVCVILFAVVMQGMGDGTDTGSSAPALSTTVSIAQTAVSSEPALSPRQQQIEDVFENQAQWQFEGTIKRLLKNPDTANFTHDKSTWVADNAILTGGGTVSYKNAKGQTVSEPFTVSIIMNNESYFPLYVELNKIVSSNLLDKVDSAGCATRLGAQEFGVAEGNSIFQQNSDKVVTIMYEEGKQSTPSKPSTSATPSQAQPSKGQSGNNQDYSGWIKYSTDDLETLLTYIAQGDVVCIDGQYYCSPRLANQKEVIVYTYDATSDPNYPRN